MKNLQHYAKRIRQSAGQKTISLGMLLFCFITTISTFAAASEYQVQVDFAFDVQAVQDRIVTDYRLYREGVAACESGQAALQSFDCVITSDPGTYNFSLTAVYSDGTESPHSQDFSYTLEPVGAVLSAVINADKTSGEAPVSITFDAAQSTGATSYSWSFGDGDTATGVSVAHTYQLPGTYAATLTVSDSSGLTSEDSLSILVTEATPPPVPEEPPTAVISATSAVGEAPFSIEFSGSGSSSPQGSIVSYAWDFGDGSSAEGEVVNHTFMDPGTFSTTLTVTDTVGLTGQASLPVIITAPAPEPNVAPTAAITTGTTGGNAPLDVSFSASASSDPDGSIVSYIWNFGDGTSASGISVQHTFTTAAEFLVTLEVTDNDGSRAMDSQVITVLEEEQINLNYEIGELAIDQNWTAVEFTAAFNDPVVIAGPPASNDTDPVTVRIRNVTQNGFEISLQEWDYQDNQHELERVSYLVLDAGVYTLGDGTMLEAGSFTGITRFNAVNLQQTFNRAPVIFTQILSENESDAVAGHVRDITTSSFQYEMQEQERTKNHHTDELVGYIAWEPGVGNVAGLLFEVGSTGSVVNHNWYDVTYQSEFPGIPFFFSGMQTSNEGDTAVVRTQTVNQTNAQVRIEEEQSKDKETDHAEEDLGYLLLYPDNTAVSQ